MRKGDELVLFDTRRGVELFRKPIGDDAPSGLMPTTTVTAEGRPPQPLHSGELGIGDFDPQLSPMQLPSPPDEAPPTAPRPTVPIQLPPTDGVSHQPQGRDLDFGELTPPPPVDGRKFEGGPPPELERLLRRDVLGPEISDIADTDLTPLPALPKTISEAPMIKLPKDEKPRRTTALETPAELRPVKMTRLAASADSLKTMLDSTARATGGTQDPTGGVIVTEEALRAESTPTDVLTSGAGRQLVIDPNVNEAWILENGRELHRFNIGTGDTTGTRFGQKYYTPNGVFQVMNEVPYGDVEGSFGPLWMGLAHNSGEKLTGPGGGGIGLHGQHAKADLNPEGPGFVNQGFVSHGCVRFRGNDIKIVGKLLDRGAGVRILPYRGQREEMGKLLAQEDGG